MADISITTYTNKTYKNGASTVVPGFVEGSPGTPVNPPGSGGASEFVPYVGANQNLNLGEFGISTGFLTLDTTPTGTPTTQGTFYWDEDDNTVDIILNGYIMKIGEDLFYPVKNQTGSSIPKGTNVRFAGTVGASGRLLIEPFTANGTYATSRYMGVTAETIADGEDGKVLWFGRIRGINTNAYNEGDILYASTSVAGGFQTTLPVAPNNIVEVAAVVTKSSTQGVIFVRPQFLSEASKWTSVGSDIYRDSAVAIGRTTIPSNATFAVQSKSATGTHQFFQLLNNAGTVLASLSQEGSFAINTTPQTNIASIFRSLTNDDTSASFRTINSSNVQTCQITGSALRVAVVSALGGANTFSDGSLTLRPFASTSGFSLFITNFAGNRQVAVPNSGAWQSLAGAFFGSSNIGIAPTGRVDIRGAGTTTGITLLLEDSTGANTFEFLDNGNLSIPSSNGAKIGTAASQKLGFWNATPIVQPTTAVAESAFVENAGGTAVNDDSTFDGYTLRQVVKALRDAGLLA